MLYKWINWFLQKRNFATILLVLFLVQIVFIEGYTISYVKVGIMALCPVMMLHYHIPVTKAMLWSGVYFVYVVTTASFHPETFRASTLIYLLMFIMMYVLFYSLVHTGVFSLQYFIRVVKYLILAYCICLILQQISVMLGIRFMPIFNLNRQFYLSIYKLPSLSLEPSHSARILGVLFYAYLKCNEFLMGNKLKLSTLFSKKHRLVTYSFLWAMLTMGSGTAFLCIGVLSLYFMQGRQLFWSLPIFVGVFFILEFFEVQQAKRVTSVIVSTASLDSKDVMETDGSAAMRVKPLLNTLQIDLSKSENWFGRGCDAGLKHGLYADDRYMAGISDFGIISFLIGLVFLFSCVYSFFSIESIMILGGITSGGVGNIAYVWGLIMIFTSVNYFRTYHQKTFINDDENIV